MGELLAALTLTAMGILGCIVTVIQDYRKLMRDLRRIKLATKRLALRKQDWTPREDPALWREET